MSRINVLYLGTTTTRNAFLDLRAISRQYRFTNQLRNISFVANKASKNKLTFFCQTRPRRESSNDAGHSKTSSPNIGAGKTEQSSLATATTSLGTSKIKGHICNDDMSWADPSSATATTSVRTKRRRTTTTAAASTAGNEVFNWKAYLALTKPSLTTLIVLSTMSACALAPGSTSVATLLNLASGTALLSGAANAINMGREPQFDKLMSRTKTRPVVRGFVSPNEAFTFAAVTASTGFMQLMFGVNPTVASLGLLNLVLYSWTYTSLKRKSILNTWVGAIVGGIPPLMGWAACCSLYNPAAWCLPALLYAWQFPHFNALSYAIRDEYHKAGYVMAAYTNPNLNARVALRYSAAMIPICIAMSFYGLTDWFFTVDSTIANSWLVMLAYKFYQHQNHKNARSLFWASVLHLPVVMVLAMLHKKGQWEHLHEYFFGQDQVEN